MVVVDFEDGVFVVIGAERDKPRVSILSFSLYAFQTDGRRRIALQIE